MFNANILIIINFIETNKNDAYRVCIVYYKVGNHSCQTDKKIIITELHLSSGKSCVNSTLEPIHLSTMPIVQREQQNEAHREKQVPTKRTLNYMNMGPSNDMLSFTRPSFQWMDIDNLPPSTSMLPQNDSYNDLPFSNQLRNAHEVLNGCSTFPSPNASNNIFKPSPRSSYKFQINSFSTFMSEDVTTKISESNDDGLAVTIIEKKKTPKKTGTKAKRKVGTLKTACSLEERKELSRKSATKKKAAAIKMIKKQIRNLKKRREDLGEFSIACIIKTKRKKAKVMYTGFGDAYLSLIRDAKKKIDVDTDATDETEATCTSSLSSSESESDDDTAAREQATATNPAKGLRETQMDDLVKNRVSSNSSFVVTKQLEGKLKLC